MDKNSTILITGATGLVGMNLSTHLRELGFMKLLTPTSSECNFTLRQTTEEYFERHNPTHVFHTAGYVRGIMGNMLNQGEAWLQNTLINTNVIEASHKTGVRKIAAMGTVAMYPDPLPHNPLREVDLWQGTPHFSEFGYAMAKRGMLAQLQAYKASYNIDYVCMLSTNLFGAHDRFNVETGHVIPSLVKKFYDAKTGGGNVTVWGDGSSKRDFIYIKDAVRAFVMAMDRMEGPVNLATGVSRTIRDAVDALTSHTGLTDRISWDTTKPAGQAFRAYDVSHLRDAGFNCSYLLENALAETFDWYAQNAATARH